MVVLIAPSQNLATVNIKSYIFLFVTIILPLEHKSSSAKPN